MASSLGSMSPSRAMARTRLMSSTACSSRRVSCMARPRTVRISTCAAMGKRWPATRPNTATSATSTEMATRTIDRSSDVSQPLDKLGPDERLKFESDYLRGNIAFDLLDRITGGVTFESNKLMKFHGIYQQDDRDIRDERRRQKLEPALTFMVRVRLPRGVCTADQWLKLDELARAHAGDTLRLTTRQTFQFHWVLKGAIRATTQGLHDVLL